MILKYLKDLLAILQEKLASMTTPMTNRERLYAAAIVALDTEVTPKDEVPDMVSCAYTFTTLLKRVEPSIQWTDGVSTTTLQSDMLNGTHFKEVLLPMSGDVVLSATPASGSPHGHVGIYMKDGEIASNDSYTGLFRVNWTLPRWKAYYTGRLGLTTRYFRLI